MTNPIGAATTPTTPPTGTTITLQQGTEKSGEARMKMADQGIQELKGKGISLDEMKGALGRAEQTHNTASPEAAKLAGTPQIGTSPA